MREMILLFSISLISPWNNADSAARVSGIETRRDSSIQAKPNAALYEWRDPYLYLKLNIDLFQAFAASDNCTP